MPEFPVVLKRTFLHLTLAAVVLLSVSAEGWCQGFASVKSTEFQRGADVPENVFESGKAAHYGPDWDEGPKHDVAVSSFRIARKQVSMGEFVRFMPEYRERIDSAGMGWQDESPAVFVSWTEANAYCSWLSTNNDDHYRLPTEAEWELAANNSAALKLEGIADGVQEWCIDWWKPYAKPTPAKPLKLLQDPRGPRSGVVRVVRDGGGGSVAEKVEEDEAMADFRITDRSATVPGDQRENLGFRVVIGQPPEFTEESEISNPIRIVSTALPDWNENRKESPHFWAGGEFINPGKGESSVVPYWNRHHVPSLAWCDNGDLLATVFTAPTDNSDQMAILIARLPWGKEGWTTAERFFVAPDHNVTSSVLYRAGEKRIHHYNGIGNNHCDDFSMIKRVSDDNGATWSEPKIVHRFSPDDESEGASPRLWPHMDLKSMELGAERLLLMSTDVAGDNDSGSAIFVSRDEGDSWREITRTGWNALGYATKGEAAGWIAGIHAPVEKLADGSLMAIGRSDNIDGFAPMSRSFDFGKTWTYSASPFPPIFSGQRSVLLRLREGPLLFISFTDTVAKIRNKRNTGMEFRDANGELQTGYGTFAAISEDEGETWSQRKLIPNWHMKPWRSRTSGYLSCVQSPDGMIHLVSSRHYYRFNLAWLREPMGSQ